jgi:type VI secretion system secreted protein VgrG
MPPFTQASRPLSLATPLGPDVLLLETVRGSEAVSELFEFELELLADADTEVAFEQVLGRPATVTLRMPEGGERTLCGIVSHFSQGGMARGTAGGAAFIRYRATVVPRVWLLTRRRQSRIFQQKSIPEILEEVLTGFERRSYLSATYEPRDYCVQYRESDFAFACRLMEEEGIFYFFEHTGRGDVLVLGDHALAHPDVPGPSALVYDTAAGGLTPDTRVHSWEKSQVVRSGKIALWDHCFELADRNLEATAEIQDRVQVGSVVHHLAAGQADALEVYDYPGGYAQRFDGIDPGGGERAADLQKIFADNERTANIRAQQEAARGLVTRGASDCRHLTAGHTFELTRHFNADGEYVLTRVDHTASVAGVYTGVGGECRYENAFECVPIGLPFRPPVVTPRPVVHGTQSAVVVGPAGEEIFTDKYGRVKVQFPWDRQGRGDAGSSCWIRVSQVHAGAGFGGIDIPRVGQEVIVAFEEGDPDRPIVIGRVYNADVMPPFALPANRMVSGLKSNTYPKGGGSNEISMNDSANGQRMFIQAEKDQDEVVKNNQTSHVMNSRTKTVDVDETTAIGNNRVETVGVDHTETIGANKGEQIGSNLNRSVGGSKSESVGMNSTETVTLAKATSVGGVYALTVGAAMNVAVGLAAFEEVGVTKKIVVGGTFEIICGASRLVMEAGGKVTIEGTEFLFAASGDVKVQGSVIDLN